MSDGQWRPSYASRKDKTGEVMVERQHLDGRVTLDELLAHVEEVAPGVPYDEIRVSVHLSWERPTTAEEHAQHARWEAERDARHAAWEARFVRIMIERYGDDLANWPTATREELAAWREKHGGRE